MRTLIKRRPKSYCGMRGMVSAYGSEDGGFLGSMRALADSVFSGGTVARDTLDAGAISFSYEVKSPIRITPTSVSFSGPLPLTVGVSINPSSSTQGTPPGPDSSVNGIGTYSAVADETRRN
jgi:hypothetical protein